MKTRAKTSVVKVIEASCVFAFAVILVLLPVHAFVSTWGGTSIGPLLVWKSWKEILLVALVPLIGLYFWLRPEVAKLLWRRPVNQLIVGYAALHVLFAFASSASTEAIIAGLLMNLRFLAMFLLAQCIVAANPAWTARLKTILPSWLLWTTAGLGVLAILQIFVLPADFLSHFGYNKDTTIAPTTLVDDNPEALRAFATTRGPNALGAYLLLPLALAAHLLVKRQKVLLAGSAGTLGLVALFLSGSRSAWLGCLAILIVLAGYILPQALRQRWLRLAVLPAIAAVIVGAWAAISIPAVRLAVFHSSPGDSSLTEGSSDKHWQATLDGARDVLAHPLGQGVGTAGPASFYNDHHTKISENYFVQIGQEVGLIGLALLVAIMALVVIRLAGQSSMWPQVLLASFAGLTVINMLLHGWADDPTAMTWWALAGLFMAEPQKRGK